MREHEENVGREEPTTVNKRSSSGSMKRGS
jgi:hypothetical protein